MKKLLLFLSIVLVSIAAFAQTKGLPFRNEIDAFLQQDKQHMPAPGSILLTGSSSFRKWTDAAAYFPGKYILNRGFGGSSLTDLIRYAAEVIIPYQPKQIFIYGGENDIAGSDTVSAQTVLQRFQELFTLVRTNLPGVPMVYISIKPSPSRWKLEPVIKESNRLIKDFLAQKKGTYYLNVHDAMLQPDGNVMTDIFIEDRLHMNAKGYAIWQKLMEPLMK